MASIRAQGCHPRWPTDAILRMASVQPGGGPHEKSVGWVSQAVCPNPVSTQSKRFSIFTHPPDQEGLFYPFLLRPDVVLFNSFHNPQVRRTIFLPPSKLHFSLHPDFLTILLPHSNRKDSISISFRAWATTDRCKKTIQSSFPSNPWAITHYITIGERRRRYEAAVLK